MNRAPWQDRITLVDDVHHGEPCIHGTRVPVRTLIASLADGFKPEEILAEYPQLSEPDLLAALAYAAEVLGHERLIPSRTAQAG